MTSRETTVRETQHKIRQVKKKKRKWEKGGSAKIKLWGLPTFPPRGSQANELVGQPIPTHFYEFPLRILVRVREA